jgi:phosphoenolpyruvate carboxylase
MPKIELSDEHEPLWEDVRRLGTSLGQTIARLEGHECYDVVEGLRAACRDRRRGSGPDLATLLDRVEQLPLGSAAVVARAFTLFLFLVNIAEQVHRVRSWRAGSTQVEPTARSALQALKRRGLSAEDARQLMARTQIRPVLTAHPTEATRRTLLALGARLADALIARETESDDERARAEQEIDAEIELLWLTSEVRRDRPSVLDEVSNAIWYLEDRLLDASKLLADSSKRAFRDVFGEPLGADLPLSFGSWVGGDRDGNSNVTPDVTLRAARRVAHAVLGRHSTEVKALIERLAVSDAIASVPTALRESLGRDRAQFPQVWQDNRRRDADEPLRLKLSFVAARIDALRRQLAARDGGAEDDTEPGAYRSASELAADLELVRDALHLAGAEHARETMVEPLLMQVRVHGFHGFELDLREDASMHARALDEIAEELRIDPLGSSELAAELLGKRPLVSRHAKLGELAERVVGTFDAVARVQAELGEAAASTYVISMTRAKDDLLRVLLFAREAGLLDLSADPPISRLDVVPLFETLDDLERSSDVLEELFADRAYARQLEARGRRQEVMIGYSDSAKGAGVLAAAWALYRAEERIADLAARSDIRLVLFHGRGGTVGRGGGSPVFRGLLALPPGTLGAGIKITEQGEVVSQKFGIPSLAERSLHVLLAGTLEAATRDWRDRVSPEIQARFRAAMDELSQAALAGYRRFVGDGERTFSLLMDATPIRELSHVHFGSRPAYREGGSGTMEGMRAIPWVFGWTQIRSNLPGWLGVGTALRSFIDQPGGLELLREMAEQWPFFDDLLSKVEMVCAKTDLEIARLYVERLAAEPSVFDELAREHEQVVDAILRIRRSQRLLESDPFLASAIALRNPYIDPLSLLQITLLAQKRALAHGVSDKTKLDAVLGTTLNGIAQGLRNTG